MEQIVNRWRNELPALYPGSTGGFKNKKILNSQLRKLIDQYRILKLQNDTCLLDKVIGKYEMWLDMDVIHNLTGRDFLKYLIEDLKSLKK